MAAQTLQLPELTMHDVSWLLFIVASLVLI